MSIKVRIWVCYVIIFLMLNKKNEKEFQNKSNDRIDELKAQLYSRKNDGIKLKRKKLKRTKIDFENTWGQKKNTPNEDQNNPDLYRYKKKGPSIFSIFFFIALIFFVGAVSFASFLFFFDKNEVSSEISMFIVGPNSTESGKVLDFVVKLENPTKLDYTNIEFVVNYPNSTLDPEDKNPIKQKVIKYKGNLLAGGKINQRFLAILSGIRDEKKEIEIKVSYKAGNFSNILFLNKIYQIEIESSPVTIEMRYPEEVLSKSDFNISIDVLSNSSETLTDLIVMGEYPPEFVVSKTEPKTVYSSKSQGIFKVDSLEAGEKKTIEIMGSLVGQNNEDKFFTFSLGDSVPFKNDIRTLFARTEESISIKRPDIDFFITSKFDNDDGEVIVPAGKRVDLDFSLSSNLESLISDLKVTASFSEDLIVKKEIETPKGFYDSNQGKIIWDKNSNELLKSLSQERSIGNIFNIRLKELEDIAGYFKDPEIVFDFEIEGTSFDSENSDGYLKEKFQKVLKIPTNVILETDIFYNEGPFQNTGSIQPKVGEPTTYTVAWKIYNSSSDIFDVEVSASLPLYVKYMNNISPENSYISYNPDNREVTLKFNKIDAFIGYRTDPKTVYFQVEMIPTDPQIGKKPILVNRKTLKAKDNFIDREIELEVKPKRTSIENDSGSGFGTGAVVE